MNAAFTTIILGAGFLFLAGQGLTQELSIAPARPDGHRLRTGQFIYRDSSNGKQLGTSRIAIELTAVGGNYDFSAETIGYGDQQWESIATPSFAPLSAKLSFGKAENSSPAFDLTYVPGRVTGFMVTHTHSKPESGMKRAVDAFVPADTVDQRIDWATVLANDLQPGGRFQFSVYDPGIGVSHVLAQVGPLERIHVPAGFFHVFRITYRVDKATGTEQYVVFASQSLPRVMVREDFPDGTRSELAEELR
jgi:hypothetical protein